MHPITQESELKNEIRKRKISYTIHFMDDVLPDRTNITINLVEAYLQDKIDDLITFCHKEDDHEFPRYNLIFDKSTQYYLLTAISFANAHINLITAFVINKNSGKPGDLVEKSG